MSWAELDPETRRTATEILTRRQLDVLKLNTNGMSTRRIALFLDIAEPTARDALKRAHQKLAIALEHRKAA